MNALLIVVAINALMLGVAFTSGGFATIVAPRTAETEELHQAIEAARARSWFHVQAEALRHAALARLTGSQFSLRIGQKDRRAGN